MLFVRRHFRSPPSRRLQKGSQGLITEVNALGYAGCRAAYREGEPWRRELIRVLRGNRDRLYRRLAEEAPEIGILPMESTYLAWMDVRPLGIENPSAFFEKHGIGLSDGQFFGSPGFLRLNFGCPPDHLEKGLDRFFSGVREARDFSPLRQ